MTPVEFHWNSAGMVERFFSGEQWRMYIKHRLVCWVNLASKNFHNFSGNCQKCFEKRLMEKLQTKFIKVVLPGIQTAKENYLTLKRRTMFNSYVLTILVKRNSNRLSFANEVFNKKEAID